MKKQIIETYPDEKNEVVWFSEKQYRKKLNDVHAKNLSDNE